MKLIPAGLMAASAFCGLSMAASAPAHAQPGRAPNRAAMTYFAKAGAGDLYGIQSSRIAVRHARDPRIRAFAATLVLDHQPVTARARTSRLFINIAEEKL